MIFKKKIVLLGATGSIGQSTLHVLRAYPEHFELVGIAANHNTEKLAAIAKEFNVSEITIFDEKAYINAKNLGLFPKNSNINLGEDGLNILASLPQADIIIFATTGTICLRSALIAIKSNKTVAFANKEILVMAGSIIMNAAKKHNTTILPIDSEHNAIFQCLQGNKKEVIESIILTASGGPFRNLSINDLKTVTVKDALRHPTWSMGQKITIDCATMANKGLELIEAHWLFNTPIEKLSVLIHPQSIIHSMVQYIDGSIIAQLGAPSMVFPIQYCLFFPHRKPASYPALDFTKLLKLELYPPDFQKFPCLKLAIDALKEGGVAPTIYNAANEVAVDAFISQKLSFLDIFVVIDKTLQIVSNQKADELETIIATHNQAIKTAKTIVNES